jgi:hypothetical protein
MLSIYNIILKYNLKKEEKITPFLVNKNYGKFLSLSLMLLNIYMKMEYFMDKLEYKML